MFRSIAQRNPVVYAVSIFHLQILTKHTDAVLYTYQASRLCKAHKLSGVVTLTDVRLLVH